MSRTRIAVVGLGQFGTTLVKQLTRYKVEVLAIDKEAIRVQEVAEICEDAVVLDIHDEEATRARLANVDILVVAIGETPLPGILLTTIAQDLGLERIIVRAHNETSRTILAKLGATETYSPEIKAAERMARNLTISFSIDSLPLASEQAIIEIKTPQDWVGRTIKEIGIRQNFAVNLICVSHTGGMDHDFSPPLDTPFKENDLLYLLGSKDRLEKVTKDIVPDQE
ncbi:MAG: TrkA family potassium uptake protein [Planctomycetota bacterium]